MNKEKLLQALKRTGWKKIKLNDRQFGYLFDITGKRWFSFTKWFVLIKFVDSLTKDNIVQYKNEFEDISKKTKSWIWGQCFLYCIIANEINASIVEDTIEGDSFGLWGVLRLKGGGGNLFLVDLNKRKIYGKVPPLPYDVHKYSKSLVKTLKKLI